MGCSPMGPEQGRWVASATKRERVGDRTRKRQHAGELEDVAAWAEQREAEGWDVEVWEEPSLLAPDR